MADAERTARTDTVMRLVGGAVDWLVDNGAPDREDPSLYSGSAGVALALQEAYEHFGDERYARAVEDHADALAAGVKGLESCALYSGLAGVAVALRALRPRRAHEPRAAPHPGSLRRGTLERDVRVVRR